MAPSKLKARVVAAFKAKYGTKVESTETTAGACKSWLSLPKKFSVAELLEVVKSAVPEEGWYDDTSFGETSVRSTTSGIEVKVQATNLFVAVPRNIEYAMGVDC